MYEYTEFAGAISGEDIYDYSPSSLHILGFLCMLAWTIIAWFIRQDYSAKKARYNRAFWIVSLLSGLGLFTVLYMAYRYKNIVGFTTSAEWQWLDSIYYAIPIYEGEWAALLFIYMAPACLLTLYCLISVDKRLREHFVIESTLRYGRMVLLAYLITVVAVMLTDMSLEKPKYTNVDPEQPF